MEIAPGECQGRTSRGCRLKDVYIRGETSSDAESEIQVVVSFFRTV